MLYDVKKYCNTCVAWKYGEQDAIDPNWIPPGCSGHDLVLASFCVCGQQLESPQVIGYWSSEGESSTTGTNWLQKVYYTKYCYIGEYLLSWYAEIMTTHRYTGARIMVCDDMQSEILQDIAPRPDPESYEDWGCSAGFKKLIFTTSDFHGYKLQYCSQSSGREVKIRRARMKLERLT